MMYLKGRWECCAHLKVGTLVHPDEPMKTGRIVSLCWCHKQKGRYHKKKCNSHVGSSWQTKDNWSNYICWCPIKKEGTVSKSFSNSIGLSWQTEFWTLLREKMKFFLERYCSEFLSIWVTEDIVIHESCDEQTQR